jgi:hypothetical protein
MTTTSKEALHGRWMPEGADKSLPWAEVEIRPDGKLRYAVKQPSGDEAVMLDYRIENGWIVTRPPAEKAEARTGFEVQPDGSLVLEFGGHRARYVRSR